MGTIMIVIVFMLTFVAVFVVLFLFDDKGDLRGHVDVA